jgi:hypothetical protein
LVSMVPAANIDAICNAVPGGAVSAAGGATEAGGVIGSRVFAVAGAGGGALESLMEKSLSVKKLKIIGNEHLGGA